MSRQGLSRSEARFADLRRTHGREALESALVVAVLALGIRTFFLQPCWIPSASMQPTLYGIRAEDLRAVPGARSPGGWRRLWERWGRGMTYHRVVARTDGQLESIERERFKVGGTWYPVPTRWPGLWDASPLDEGRRYQRGEDLIHLRLTAGDRILIDRLTYNFRRPRRGEIVAFSTAGLRAATPDLGVIPPDCIYTKRLVGLPGETVAIGADRQVRIQGARLGAEAPHFHRLYGFDPAQAPRVGHYGGHVNAASAAPLLTPGQPNPAPLFPDANATLQVRSRHVWVLGDNTLQSLDGRAWGDSHVDRIIGRFVRVYWPISDRAFRRIP